MIKKNKTKIDSFFKKIKSNKPVLGTFIQIPSNDNVEIISQNNYDWIALDAEHGLIDTSNIVDLIRIIDNSNSLPIIRLGESTELECKKVMDAGALGVIAPMIKNADDIKKIINFCSWPPKGKRGVGFSRVSNYGKNFNEYSKVLSQSPIVIPMIENVESVNNLDEILNLKEIQIFFIGPYDLSSSLGVPGQFTSRLYKNTIKEIKDKILKKNKFCGIHVVEPNEKLLRQTIRENFKFIAYSLDSVFLRNSSINPLS
tara:strand:- start:277 stop:1047 length:771 start_codon:yes stop_codon:yes gene_type:complete